MHVDCIKKVMAAANRTLSAGKIKAIEDAIAGKRRELARQDPQAWAAKSKDQQITEAAQAAMKDIEAEGARTEYLGTLQILKTDETGQRIAAAKNASAMELSQSQALIRDIQNTNEYVHAVRDEAVSTLGAMMDAAGSKDGTGVLRNLAMRIWDLDNPQMTADVLREVFKNADGHTGNKAAQAGARAWLDTIENMRLRFNAAGGNVGRLAYGYLSQMHDAAKIAKAGAQDYAQRVLPLLDRLQYIKEDGAVMKDAEVLKILESAHETLASNGLNKVEIGQYKGAGKRANAGADHRVLHFKDGDAWMAYMREFGEGSLYDAMIGHISQMARNIGLVERMGPNPEMNFRVQADIAQRADGAGTMANRSVGNTPDAYWAILSGKTGAPENAVIAKAFQDVRNVQTAAKLGGAVITSFSDVGTIAATLHYDRLPYFAMLKNVARNMSKDHRDFLQAHGVIAENLTSTLNRWTGDHLTHSLTGRVANSVMKLSFMNAWTDGLRSAFSATMMQGFAKKVGKAWGQLDEWDQFLMTRKGITESDWGIISKATPTERDGVKYLTRDGIHAIPDGEVSAILKTQLDAMRDRAHAEITDLTQRNVQDNAKLTSRIQRVQEAEARAADRLNRFMTTRDTRLQKAGEWFKAQQEMLRARVEVAETNADIDAYLLQQKSRNQMTDAVIDLITKRNPERSAERVLNEADKRGDAFSRRRGRIGEKLGERRGNAERRIVEIEARLRQFERDADAEVKAKYEELTKQVESKWKEVDTWLNEMKGRVERRDHVINRIASSVQPQTEAMIKGAKQQAASKWMAFVSDEAQFAVVNPDMATRAIVTGGGMPAGTVRGEAMRTFMQFKSFPMAMLTRHWGRVFDTPQGLEGAPAGFGAQTATGAGINRMAVLAGLNVSLMLLGAVVLQVKAMLQGKDPYDMTEPKFWPRALGQGGGMGYVGDFLLKDPTEQRGSNFEQTAGVVSGPAGGAVAGLLGDLVLTNAWEAAKGKETHAGGEAIRWANSQLPYVSLWQTRGAWEHWFIHNAQEAVNPGYLGRMRARAMRDWQQDYYWKPGEAMPERAPDLGKAIGE